MKKCVFALLSILICNVSFADSIWESAFSGNQTTVQKYVEKIGVDVNARDDLGNTALHYAALKNRFDVVAYLISKKADVNAINQYKQPVFQLAIDGQSSESLKLLLENGADIRTPLTRDLSNISGSQVDSLNYTLNPRLEDQSLGFGFFRCIRLISDFNSRLPGINRMKFSDIGKSPHVSNGDCSPIDCVFLRSLPPVPEHGCHPGLEGVLVS